MESVVVKIPHYPSRSTSSRVLIPHLLLLLQLLCMTEKGWGAVVVFTTNYTAHESWNWEAMTHLAFWGTPPENVRAQAASSNVRLFAAADGFPGDPSKWVNQTYRSQSVASSVRQVQENPELGGVFFDFEGNGLSKDQKAGYALLANETALALRACCNATIFICVGGRPTYEFRDYPYKELAASSEFLFIMGYDMHFWDDYTCVVKGTCSPAEASIKDLDAGVAGYLESAEANKLVLGLPWYGQLYTKEVPINKGQIDYRNILLAEDVPGLVVKKELMTVSQSWKITCNGNCNVDPTTNHSGGVIWYDDAQTLAPKYALARNKSLLGVGVWKIDDLPSPDITGKDPHKLQREAMWNTLAAWNKSADLEETTLTPATLVQTTEIPIDGSTKPDRFLRKPDIPFSPRKPDSTNRSVSVHTLAQTGARARVIKGFGGAFTDSVSQVFSQLSEKNKERVLELIWGPTGNKYSLGRLTIGATDFSTTVYNYNGGAGADDIPDYLQENFSIAHDHKLIIPLIKEAQLRVAQTYTNTSTKLRFISSPWSPPAWMKAPYLSNKGHMRNSAKPGMKNDPKIYRSYALYISKYIKNYADAGINISYITVQNEPDSADHMFPVAYPACNFDGEGEGTFLKDFLGPQIMEDHPDVKIYIHDGQKFHDVPMKDRVDQIIKAVGEENSTFVHGVAFHWYGNNLKNYQYLAELRAAYPHLDLLGTEATLESPLQQHLGTTPWKEAQKYAVDIIGDLNAGANGWLEWNVLLDSTGGPTCIGTTGGTDCVPLAGHCDAPILANLRNQSLEIRSSYYFSGHFSRYVPPGSRHLDISGDGLDTNSTFMATAAQTPAGEVVVVVLNTDAKSHVAYDIEVCGQYGEVTIPPHSIQTIIIKNTAGSCDS